MLMLLLLLLLLLLLISMPLSPCSVLLLYGNYLIKIQMLVCSS